ncbi:hypothetical protein RQP46_009308 [Phenoliferia psychrophenolica]
MDPMKQEADHLDEKAQSSTNEDSADVAPMKTMDSDDGDYDLSWRVWMVVFACAMWGLIYAGTQITLLFWTSAITADIGGETESLWIGQAFQVTTAILGPLLARIGDTCGRREVILFGVAVGGIGCIIISVAPTVNVAIAGATVFGVCYASGGNIYTASSEVLPRRHRGTAQITILLGSITGVLLGLYVGANFIQNNPGGYPGWRSASWFNVATHFVTFLLFFFFYHPSPVPNPQGLTVAKRIMQIDWLGCLLLGAGICPLMVGLIWGGAVYPWGSATIIAVLVVGVGMFGLLAVHQVWFRKDGLFSHQLFQNPNFLTCLLSILVEGLIYNVFTHYFAVETAVLWDPRPYFLATRFMPFTIGAALACPAYGYYVYRYKDAKYVLVFGYSAFLAGVIGMAAAKLDTDKITVVYSTLCGVGFAAPLVFLNMVTQLSVDPALMGLATALVISSRAIGGALGIAICGAVFTSKVTESIPAYVAKAALEAGLPATSLKQFIGGLATKNATLVGTTPGVTTLIVEVGTDAIRRAYLYSFQMMWLTAIPFIAVGILGLFALKSTKKEMNAVVDRPVEYTHHKESVSEA